MFMCDNLRCLVASGGIHKVSIKQCTACKQSTYCSKTCQREAMSNGHRFSCQLLLAKTSGNSNANKKMCRDILKRIATAAKLHAKHNFDELGEMQQSLLGDADALLVNTENYDAIFNIYEMLSAVHEHNDNVNETHRFNLMKKYMVDRMEDSVCNHKYKALAYMSVGETYTKLGQTSESIVIYTKCFDYCKEYINGQRHLCTRRAHAYLELGEYQTCIDQIKYAATIADSPCDTLASAFIPSKRCETSGQLLLVAQCHMALGNYHRALIFYKILWYYGKVKTLKDCVKIARAGIATAIYARAKKHCCVSTSSPNPTKQTVNLMYSYSNSLKQASVWYLETPPVSGGVFTSTSLRMAFLYYDMACHKTLQEEGTLTHYRSHPIDSDGSGISIEENVNEIAEELALEMENPYSISLQRYLMGQIRDGHMHCGFCHQCRHTNDKILTCSGCGVVRFCNKQHQKMASKRVSIYGGRHVITHKSICKLLGEFVKFSENNSLPNAYSYLAEQRAFLQRGMVF